MLLSWCIAPTSTLVWPCVELVDATKTMLKIPWHYPVERTKSKNNTQMSSSLAFRGIFNGAILRHSLGLKKIYVKGERAPGEYWAASITMASPLSHKLYEATTRTGRTLYIEEHTLRTTKVLRQIGCSARHFWRNFPTPAPSPDRDKSIEFMCIDHLLFFKK